MHSVRESRSPGKSSATFDEVFTLLLAGGLTQDALFDAVVRSHTEIVLTAHPTQVNRRTLQCVPHPLHVQMPCPSDGFHGLTEERCKGTFELDVLVTGTSIRGWLICCSSMTGALFCSTC